MGRSSTPGKSAGFSVIPVQLFTSFDLLAGCIGGAIGYFCTLDSDHLGSLGVYMGHRNSSLVFKTSAGRGVFKAAASRGVALSLIAVMLSGTALAPATAQVFDLGGGPLTVTGFAGAPINGATEITNGALRANIAVAETYAGSLTDSLGILSFRKDGLGVLTLSGVNTHSGTTSVTNGTLLAGSTTALSANSLLSVGGPVGVVAVVDLGGFNNTVAGLSGSSRAAITSTGGAAVLTIDTDVNRLFSGALQGDLGIIKTGTGTQTFTNADPALAATTATGPITLLEGGIAIGSNNALGSGVITVAGAGTLSASAGTQALDNDIVLGAALTALAGNGRTLQLNGDISGAGSLVKTGIGTLRLAGDNSYTGGTQLAAGRVEVGSDTAFGTGVLTKTGGATLALADPAVGVTLANDIALTTNGFVVETGNVGVVFGLSGDISGDRNVAFAATSNGGTLLLSGDNSAHTGALIAGPGGVLGIGSSAAVGADAFVRFATGGTMAFAGADLDVAGTVSTVIGGGPAAARIDTAGFNASISGTVADHNATDTLALVKAGDGTLTLAAANSYTGGTTIEGGSLAVGVDGALGSGAVVIRDGGALAAGADGLVITNNIAIEGRGTVNTGANTLTIAGTISDVPLLAFAGQWQVDQGPDWFSSPPDGPLAYTGQEAAALLFGGNAADYQISTLGTDPALVNNQAWYSIIGVGGGTALAQDYSSKYLGSFYGPTSGFTLNDPTNAASAYVDDNATGAAFTNYAFTGTGAAPGTLVKAGSGTLILTGVNTYSGGTDITEGTIAISSDTALGTGDISFSGLGGTLQALASFSTAKAITLNAGGTIDSNGFDVTLDGVIDGAGGLSKVGAGLLALTGVNTYSGGTTLTQGTISIGNVAALGTGTVTTAAGTTLLAGADLFNLSNNVVLNGGTTIDTQGFGVLMDGAISGTGALTKVGAGNLALYGANSYTGGTNVDAGTLFVNSAASAGTGTIAMANGTTFAVVVASTATPNNMTLGGLVNVLVDPGFTATLSGVVADGSAAGSLSKFGAGNLVLAGANSYSGDTFVNDGTVTLANSLGFGTSDVFMGGGTTLAAGASSLNVANAVQLNGPVTINTAANTLQLSGVVSGVGSVTKNGTGILTMTGASTYTGATTVAAGTLNVTGSLASAVTANAGAAVTGTGAVGGLVVSSGATLSPGAVGTTNVGTLSVNGAASLAGTYSVNILGTTSDRLAATGPLSLGGTLAVTSVSNAKFNTVYTVASGSSRTGTFGTVTGLNLFGPAFLTTVEYTATGANIRTAPNSLLTLLNNNGGGTLNAQETARAFDRAVAAGYNPQAFLNVYTAGAALPRTLLEMSGEQRATERRVVLETNRVFRETALDRLNLGLAALAGQQVQAGDEDTGAVTFWLRGAGSWGTADTSGAATRFTTEQRGILTGMDWARNGVAFGAMFHYTSTDIDYEVLGGSSNVETTGGTVYAGYRQQDKGFVANAGLSVAGARTTGARAITLPGFAQTLAGRTRGTTYQVFGELAVDLAGSASTRIEPFARLTYVQADMGALNETGGIAALQAAKQTHDIAVTNVGLRAGSSFADGKVSLNASAAWQRTSGSREAVTALGIPAVGQTALIRSVSLDPDAALLQADLGFNLSDRARINVGYSGLIGRKNSDHAGRATLSFAF